MNRAERRRKGNAKRVPTYNLTSEQLDAMVLERVEEYKSRVIHYTTSGMTAAFAVSLNEYFGFGKKRLTRLKGIVENQFECIADNYVTMGEINKYCNEEFGWDLPEEL